MADPKYVDGGQGLSGVADLLKLVGGTKSTQTSGGDTGALSGVLNSLQSIDPAAQLASIFQQAAGAAPGIGARFSNAVGARSGSNAPVAAAMEKLLQQTTLAGQQQIAAQQLQNLATQGNVAGAIANNTNKTTTSSGLDLGNTAKLVGGAQALAKFSDSSLFKKGKDIFAGLFDSGDAASSIDGASDAASFVGPMQPLADAFSSEFSDAAGLGAFTDSFDSAGIGGSLYDEGGSSLGDWWEGMTFADGGLVGRDGIPAHTRKRMADAGLDEESAPPGTSRADQLKRLNEEEKAKKSGKAKNDYDRTSNMVDQKTGIRFADGGEVDVRSAGGRRSSAPGYVPDEIQRSLAQNFRQSLPTGTLPVDSGGKATEVNAPDPNAPTVSMGAIASALNGMMGAANVALAPTPIGVLGLLAKVARFAMSSGPAPGAQGYNSLGLATGVDNGMGYSGLNAAISGEGAFGEGTVADNSSPGEGGAGDSDAGDGGGYGSGGGYGGGTGTNGSAGTGYGYGSGGPGSTASAANGGQIRGKGTGTSDSIKANLSNGEYVMSADVVDTLGASFFDNLQKHFHTPVATKKS